jgi:dipeptidyl aminopeptidase/acylaminoacyl peptidase
MTLALKRSRPLQACASLLLTAAGALGGVAVAPPSSLAAAVVPASVSIDATVDSLLGLREIKQVAISPDGARVAWVEALPESATARDSFIYSMELRAQAQTPRRITAGDGKTEHAEHDIAWSPDGKQLCFLSDAEKADQLQLYVASVGGSGSPRRLTSANGFIAGPSWSPDGSTIALLFTENAAREAGPLVAATPDAGVVAEHIDEQRLTLVDPASGALRQVSPANLYVYEFDWSPDGKSAIATAAPGSGDDNWYVAELYRIDLASGSTRSILKPGMQIAMPCCSPDGKRVAFIGGLMSDEGIPAGDIYVVSAEGGEPRNLTPALHASAAWLQWLPDRSRILFAEHVDGMSGFATLDPSSGSVRDLWTGEGAVTDGVTWTSLSVARDGKSTAVVRQSFASPPEVCVGPIGGWKQLTHVNSGLHPTWGAAESLHWTSDDLQIQGWLIRPRGFDPSRRYPLVVIVHGGPSWMTHSTWPTNPFSFAPLSAAGYFVLLPNPRGSYGAGEAFTRGNVKDFGHGDLRDILAGVDEVEKRYPIDDARLGLAGWSYGGFMAMFASTQTQRFRAVVAGAGISNWQSYYGQNRIDQWMIPFFGASVYDDPEVYARSSAIRYIKNAKSPALVLVGERDAECPAPQSYEFHHALKTLGVPVQMVVYAGEGHHFRKVEHRRDIGRRMVGWFETYLREPAR